MSITTFDQLLEAGVHFGHLKRKWNPAMAPYIFMERNGIHIIDLYKTVAKIDEAAAALKSIAKSGKKILFVATKKQAKQVVADKASAVNMPYVIERWPGGMLTNFPTIRKAVKKMSTIDKMEKDGTFDNLSKREKLQISRQRAKLEKTLGSIADLNRLPSALFVVDVLKEHIAVRELDAVCGAIAEGLEERKAMKEDAPAEGEEAPVKKERKARISRKKADDAEVADAAEDAAPEAEEKEVEE